MPTNHTAGIYEKEPTGRFISPFSLKVEPMERLLLINLGRDPDTLYLGFEPQVFDDPVNGKGLMVIAYLKDGKIDIYHQPGLTLEHNNYDVVGKGLSDLLERPFEGARFEVRPQGVDIQFAFEDKQGRSISVRICENSRKPRRPFSLLAPFPSAAEKPPSLPLALLYDFYFVRQAGTELEIQIDGKSHQPDSLPAPVDGSRMTFVRYSTDPLILNWNEAYDGSLTPLQPQGAGELEDRGVIYNLVEHAGHFEIQEMRPVKATEAGHEIRFSFDPPFPDVAGLRDGTQAGGDFTVWLEESMGRIDGVYQVRRSGSRGEIEVHPNGGWHPGVRKWSVRIMFRLIPLFKNWPKSYRWTARLDLSQADAPRMESGWSRLPAKRDGAGILFKG